MSEDQPQAAPMPDEATAKRIGAKLVPILREPPLGRLTAPQAALLAAHLVFGVGAEKAEAMTLADALKYGAELRKAKPLAWAALLRGNAHGLVHALAAHDPTGTTETPERIEALAALLKP